MDDSDLVSQKDEIDALASIYGEEWCVIDEDNRIFSITINDDDTKPCWTVKLQVVLPDGYPSCVPPIYQLNAPWLRGPERKLVQGKLEQLYLDNIGLSIIYLWVEQIRDHLRQKGGNNSEPVCNKQTEETDFSEDLSEEWATPDEELSLEKGENSETEDSSIHVTLPQIHHGEPIIDRRSVFQPHLAIVESKQQVRLVLEELLKNRKIANATHNIMAYRIFDEYHEVKNVYISNCDDDGETHAGQRMLYLLKILDVKNVMIVVSRWYGGILLGPDRFKHICNCCRNILEEHGYINPKEGEGKKKSKKRKS